MSDWETFFFVIFVCTFYFWFALIMCVIGAIMIQIEKFFLKRKEQNEKNNKPTLYVGLD